MKLQDFKKAVKRLEKLISEREKLSAILEVSKTPRKVYFEVGFKEVETHTEKYLTYSASGGMEYADKEVETKKRVAVKKRPTPTYLEPIINAMIRDTDKQIDELKANLKL